MYLPTIDYSRSIGFLKKKQRELPDGVLATREDLPAMLYLLAGVAEVCAAAVSASANARYLKEHRGLSDEE